VHVLKKDFAPANVPGRSRVRTELNRGIQETRAGSRALRDLADCLVNGSIGAKPERIPVQRTQEMLPRGGYVTLLQV